MATMIKEKRKEKKKKTKDKTVPTNIESDSMSHGISDIENKIDSSQNVDNCVSILESEEYMILSDRENAVGRNIESTQTGGIHQDCSNESVVNLETTVSEVSSKHSDFFENIDYGKLNYQLEKMNISDEISSTARSLLHRTKDTGVEDTDRDKMITESDMDEIACPSAPALVIKNEEVCQLKFEPKKTKAVLENKKAIQCMPLEEAIRIYGGREIMEVLAISEKEESIVEAGPTSGPEHPLVDLLSTLRCSLKAVEKERIALAHGYIEEEKLRSKLWKVEKRVVHITEPCSCGSNVELKATYEHAELLKSQLPVAKMKLESLLRDTQDSYCHHQHLALMAYNQIEHLISATMESHPACIREALSLVLGALRTAEGGVWAAALRRWAGALAGALLQGGDTAHTLFLMHHMFRQSLSVRWAARLLSVRADDGVAAARALAVLGLFLCGACVDGAKECTEEAEEVWEEVDERGGGGALAEGALRERDLRTVLRAMPLAGLLARLALLAHRDVSAVRESEWGDASGGRGVLKSLCGARLLLSTLERARRVHVHYPRLAADLAALALDTVAVLADLHLHARSQYCKELEETIAAELDVCVEAAFSVLVGARASVHALPYRVLRGETATTLCMALATTLHENGAVPPECSSWACSGALGCAHRVRLVAAVAVDRLCDYGLAHNMLEFLMQTGLKRLNAPCGGACNIAARESLPKLLSAHPHLYNTAFQIFADLHISENTDADSISILEASQWRPSPAQAAHVLTELQRRCPAVLQPLLLALDCTPHFGVSLESQLTIASWLIEYQRGLENLEWPWKTLRRLRVHRTYWGLPLDVPNPDKEGGLFVDVFNLMATSWGHCLPIICEAGVEALLRLAKAERTLEAVQCLGPVLLVMTQSPESVSLTPRFGAVFGAVLAAGGGAVRRALGRGWPAGAPLLSALAHAHLAHNQCVSRAALLSVWVRGAATAAQGAGPAACSLAERAVLCAPLWPALHEIVAAMLQEEGGSAWCAALCTHAARCPCACAAALLARHGQLARDMYTRLLHELHAQRTHNQRTHVDNALKAIGSTLTSEDLVIHKTAAAILVAPLHGPGHLMLWMLFFNLYLQRPPQDLREETLAVGPLFFSGLIKSRVLAQLKRRLQEADTFHRDEKKRLSDHISSQKQILLSKESTKPVTPIKVVTKESDDLIPPLSLSDLTGEEQETEESSDSESEIEEEIGEENLIETERTKQLENLYLYHCQAHDFIRLCIACLEEGDTVRRWPHSMPHFDDKVLAAACSAELERTAPPSPPDVAELAGRGEQPATPPPPATPLQRVVARLQRRAPRTHTRSRSIINSTPEELRVREPRALISLLDRHLDQLETLAREWCAESARVSALDGALWPLVSGLRVRAALPPVPRRCANNCRAVLLLPKVDEWCISTGAEKGIKDNRCSARAALRKLARPRPHLARVTATLHTIASGVRSAQTAVSVLERAWRRADHAHLEQCAAAALALADLFTDLGERWVSAEGDASLAVARWAVGSAGSGALRQRLARSVLAPRRLPPAARLALYVTLLQHAAPHAAAACCLSKFEVSKWSAELTAEQRAEALAALTEAAQREGCDPPPGPWLEVVGVHSALLTDARTLPGLVAACVRGCVAGRLPPAHWHHVRRAAETHARACTLQQLGDTLRHIGHQLSQAGTERARAPLAAHATPLAHLTGTLMFALVDVARDSHCTPEQVAQHAWAGAVAGWAPWAGGLIPAPELRAEFVRTLADLALACTGYEGYILRQAWEWMVSHAPLGSAHREPEQRAHLAALMEELTRLPWHEHRWFSTSCMPALATVWSSGEEVSVRWCCHTLQAVSPGELVGDVPAALLAPHLHSLLQLLATAPLHPQTVEAATQLPWWRLPLAALLPAMELFFQHWYSTDTPYHERVQFSIIVYASELAVHRSIHPEAGSERASEKRHAAVSLWVRAAAEAALQQHAAGAARCLLHTVQLGPDVRCSEDEISSLLGRAITMLCTEPAATRALPVWQQWVRDASPELALASLSAAASLTNVEYLCAFAEVAVTAYMRCPESSWSAVQARWASLCWGPGPLLSRGALLAAYGAVLARPPPAADLARALRTLLSATLPFVEKETVIALWICVAARVGEGTLLAEWGAAPRRSLLRTLTLQGDADRPTPGHRLLCCYAQCAAEPHSEELQRALEGAAGAWLKAARSPAPPAPLASPPHPRGLPALCAALYPYTQHYFDIEASMAASAHPDHTSLTVPTL